MGGKNKKEYLPLNSGTVLSETTGIFLRTYDFKVVIITVPPNGETATRQALFSDPEIEKLFKKTKLIFVQGGETRQLSVLHALEAIENCDMSLFMTALALLSPLKL